ncbi:hypothetical protein [Thalassospira sp. MCCC 1A03138]|uniref:hypothetical protein n=1 Tax=Thalassospira sp. MCCC 1A03138 TaxID=1470576 RepID=UPI001FEEEDEC|nr:hypothetical protein [Thalassospira sp. MCCC 1A03138]
MTRPMKIGIYPVKFMVSLFVAGAMIAGAGSVLAQSDSPLPAPVSGENAAPDANDVQAGASGAEAKPTVTVTRSACQQLVSHVPDDDVAYKPGVDVYGNKVAPADLDGGSPILDALPKEIEFPVTIDFFEYAGISVPDGISGESNIGRITYRNGRVYFNDIPLGNEAGQDELAAACRAAGFR